MLKKFVEKLFDFWNQWLQIRWFKEFTPPQKSDVIDVMDWKQFIMKNISFNVNVHKLQPKFQHKEKRNIIFFLDNSAIILHSLISPKFVLCHKRHSSNMKQKIQYKIINIRKVKKQARKHTHLEGKNTHLHINKHA